jgi:hypothetical protein
MDATFFFVDPAGFFSKEKSIKNLICPFQMFAGFDTLLIFNGFLILILRLCTLLTIDFAWNYTKKIIEKSWILDRLKETLEDEKTGGVARFANLPFHYIEIGTLLLRTWVALSIILAFLWLFCGYFVAFLWLFVVILELLLWLFVDFAVIFAENRWFLGP